VPQQWWKLCRNIAYGCISNGNINGLEINSCFFFNSQSELTFWITYVLWGLTTCLYVYNICVFFRAIRNFSRVSTVGAFKTAHIKARHCTLAYHYKFLRFHRMKTHRGLLLHDIIRN
jgi:hypothetical protein